MVLMLVTMMMPSMAVVREKEIGTLEQIIVTPLAPWQLIVGKLCPFVAIGIFDLLLITGVARWLFGGQVEDADRHEGAELADDQRSAEHTSELQSPHHLVCPLLLFK